MLDPLPLGVALGLLGIYVAWTMFGAKTRPVPHAVPERAPDLSLRIATSPTQAAQFSCLTNCSTQSVTFDSGMTVTVTATAVSGRKITGWSGVTCTNVPVLNGTSSSCTFVVTGTATVRVTYA